MFSTTIKTVGNPDMQQYARITDPFFLKDESFQELRKKIRHYCLNEHIGAGNWTNPILYKDEQPIGYLSYNCRVWEVDSSFNNGSVEIIVPN